MSPDGQARIEATAAMEQGAVKATPLSSWDTTAKVSIAISLKRIADLLEVSLEWQGNLPASYTEKLRAKR